MKEPAIFPVSPPHSRLANERLSGFKRRAPFGAQLLLHLQDGSCSSNPTPANLLKGGRHIPASRGCRSRHHHSAKRCEQTLELYLPGRDTYAHWRAAPPPPIYAR